MNAFRRIRNVRGCPICLQPKSVGLIICWECNGNLKSQHHGDWGAAANALLQRVEYMLMCAGCAEWFQS